ncbi:MAG: hypothetical protein EOP35_10230 [Rubrivivax sp.]|nr:MAG: hypothetical protein EOP35_10230 [Rubrivivax sp.]
MPRRTCCWLAARVLMLCCVAWLGVPPTSPPPRSGATAAANLPRISIWPETPPKVSATRFRRRRMAWQSP